MAAMLLYQEVNAAAFYISEIGTPSSLGTAGAANPTNTLGADAAFTNPAGMTGLDKDDIVTGFQFVLPKINFDADIAEAGGGNGGNVGVKSAIPSFFAVKKLSERARLGFSVTAPLGAVPITANNSSVAMGPLRSSSRAWVFRRLLLTKSMTASRWALGFRFCIRASTSKLRSTKRLPRTAG
jgi:long-subunit fatty acid transport protein